MSTPTEARWRLYTPDEVAEILHVSRATVYRRVKGRRALPHRSIEGRLMFTTDDVDTILRRAERGSRR